MATNIGTRIMERRQQLGITQEELAFRMGYKTKSAINKIELGINDVSQSKVIKFAEALHTSVAYLMGWENADVSLAPSSREPDIPARNIIRIAGRDGSYEERILTDEQISALKVLLSQLPDASGDL